LLHAEHCRVGALVLVAIDGVETHLLFAVVLVTTVDKGCRVDALGLLAHELDHVRLKSLLGAFGELAVHNADAGFIVDFLDFLGWLPIWILDAVAVK